MKEFKEEGGEQETIVVNLKKFLTFLLSEGGRYEDEQKIVYLSLCINFIYHDGLLPSMGC